MTLYLSHNNFKHPIMVPASLPSSCHICHFHDNHRERCSIGALLKGAPAQQSFLGFHNIKLSIVTHSHAVTSNRHKHRYLTHTQTLPHPLNSPTTYDTSQRSGCRSVQTFRHTNTLVTTHMDGLGIELRQLTAAC